METDYSEVLRVSTSGAATVLPCRGDLYLSFPFRIAASVLIYHNTDTNTTDPVSPLPVHISTYHNTDTNTTDPVSPLPAHISTYHNTDTHPPSRTSSLLMSASIRQ